MSTTLLYPLPAQGPVSVTVQVTGTSAWVTAKIQPGAVWWSQPDAATLRRLVDEAAAEQGMHRQGPRVDVQQTNTSWRWLFPLSADEN